MKIAILGLGAMGSVYAALFAEAGHEVWGIDPWEAHVTAIKKGGLRLEGASGNRVVKDLQVTTTPEDVTGCNLVIIATKASGVGAAAQAAAGMLGPYGLVLTIQNGLGAADRIAPHIDLSQVLLGVADGFGASIKGPGHAHHNAMNLIRIGEAENRATERVAHLVKLWQDAGFNARGYDDITQLIWEKFLCNVTFSAPCTVFNQTVGALMATPEHWRIALGAMQEAYTLASLLNIALSFDDPEDYVTKFGAKMPNARPSMLLDHMANRPSELAAINGMVPVLGHKHGVPTPYNETLCAVLRQREAAF